jgi:hypothetical protein
MALIDIYLVLDDKNLSAGQISLYILSKCQPQMTLSTDNSSNQPILTQQTTD